MLPTVTITASPAATEYLPELEAHATAIYNAAQLEAIQAALPADFLPERPLAERVRIMAQACSSLKIVPNFVMGEGE